MNNIEVEVISKEIIKPSSPTPDNLRHYQVSFLDQLAPQVYNPLLLFYQFNAKTMPNNIPQISNHLKNSLSEVLTFFYPLAGRLHKHKHKHKSFVDCNDEGIPYFEAQVNNCRLSDVLNNPNPNELNRLLPFELDDLANTFLLGVQLNIFQCGGFAIGQCISHKIADGLSYLMLSKTWAAIARGDQANIQPPEFVSATLFPPVEFDNIGLPEDIGITRDRVAKRFVFHASQIESLRAKYEQNMPLKRPTRVETLSAFIWGRFVAATKASGTMNKLYRVAHAVNLRQRCEPPLPQHYFGNLFCSAMTSPLRISSADGDEECVDHGLMMMIKDIREEIRKIDNEYVKMLQVKGDEYYSGLMKQIDGNSKKEETATVLSFSSHCRFPRYDSDFGWGKPTWVGSPALTYQNVVLFMDTKEGDGIEAYVALEEQVMAKFQRDNELLAYVSSTGQVLN